jgi:hypothetical protein
MVVICDFGPVGSILQKVSASHAQKDCCGITAGTNGLEPVYVFATNIVLFVNVYQRRYHDFGISWQADLQYLRRHW